MIIFPENGWLFWIDFIWSEEKHFFVFIYDFFSPMVILSLKSNFELSWVTWFIILELKEHCDHLSHALKHGLKNHIKIHHPVLGDQSGLTCYKCGHQAENSEDFTFHRKSCIQKLFKCKVCDNRFTTKQSCYMHTRSKFLQGISGKNNKFQTHTLMNFDFIFLVTLQAL